MQCEKTIKLDKFQSQLAIAKILIIKVNNMLKLGEKVFDFGGLFLETVQFFTLNNDFWQLVFIML